VQSTPVLIVTDDIRLELTFDEFPGQVIDLSGFQQTDSCQVRIYQNQLGELLTVGTGFWLVAEVRLPGKVWISEAQADEDGNPVLDDQGNPVTRSVIRPLTVNDVQITLWDLPETKQ